MLVFFVVFTIRNHLVYVYYSLTRILLLLQCKKLRSEAALLPSIKAELEALRFRHTAALELMGERDEEVILIHLQFTYERVKWV